MSNKIYIAPLRDTLISFRSSLSAMSPQSTPVSSRHYAPPRFKTVDSYTPLTKLFSSRTNFDTSQTLLLIYCLPTCFNRPPPPFFWEPLMVTPNRSPLVPPSPIIPYYGKTHEGSTYSPSPPRSIGTLSLRLFFFFPSSHHPISPLKFPFLTLNMRLPIPFF